QCPPAPLAWQIPKSASSSPAASCPSSTSAPGARFMRLALSSTPPTFAAAAPALQLALAASPRSSPRASCRRLSLPPDSPGTSFSSLAPLQSQPSPPLLCRKTKERPSLVNSEGPHTLSFSVRILLIMLSTKDTG